MISDLPKEKPEAKKLLQKTFETTTSFHYEKDGVQLNFSLVHKNIPAFLEILKEAIEDLTNNKF